MQNLTRKSAIFVRCLPEEAKQIKRAAKREGKTISEWMRSTLLEAAKLKRQPQASTAP